LRQSVLGGMNVAEAICSALKVVACVIEKLGSTWLSSSTSDIGLAGDAGGTSLVVH
jgi:hypothetical protein